MKEQCVATVKCNEEQDKSPENRGVLRESKSNVNTSSACELHSSVLLYCSDCAYVICGQCEKRHLSHTLVNLGEASKMNKSKMTKEAIHVKNLIRYANIVIKDLNSYLEKLEATLGEMTNEIFERSLKLPQGHEILTETVLADLSSEHDKESNRIRNKISEFDEFISSAKNVLSNMNNLVNAVDDQHVIMKGNVILKKASGLEATLPACPKEKCMYVLAPLDINEEGKEYTVEEIQGQISKVSVPWRIEVKRIGSFRPEAVSSRFVTTMCPADDGHVWVVWQWGPMVHLINKDGDVVRSVDIGCKVDDICTNDGNLVISCHESKCIKIINKKQNFEIVQTIQTEKVPRGIYHVSEKELVTCCVQNLHHRNGDTSTLVRMNADSGEVTEIPCSEHLVQPWRIAVNVNGDICVSDRNKGSVMIFDTEGNLKATYSGPDLSTRHPFAPHAVCCDRYGQIYVVDYTNHTVHVLDPLGRFRGFLIMDTELEKRAIYMGTSSPFAMTIDTDGNIWVGNKFGYLTVLEIK